MKKLIRPSTINGTIKAPSSKSMLQRAIAASLLSENPVKISNATYSEDSKAALRVIQTLGANIDIKDDEVFIQGGLNPRSEILNCGEAGLSIRMFTSIAALHYEALTLSGEGSLLKRPVTMVEQPLRDLGIQVNTHSGFPPLTVKGPLKGGIVQVDGSISSQFLTGLLMALPKALGDSRIFVKDLKSTPYIDMTLSLLEDFGIEVRHFQYEIFDIKGNQNYKYPHEKYWVEGDWSGASFLLVAGAIGGSITVNGLNMNSKQADIKILQALEAAGATLNVSNNSVTVTKSALRSFQFDATHCPDLFPPLVVLASNCKGTTILTGVERLIHKESNRAQALEKEFSKLGIRVITKGNHMEITGGKIKGGIVDSFSDHRIAMAGALAAIQAENNISIDDSQCVAKSYPQFFDDLRAMGGRVDE